MKVDEIASKYKTGSRLELFTNEASPDEANVYLYGRVQDTNYWEDDNVIVPREVINMLQGIKSSVINLHINSYGGSAFAGIAIHNVIKQHKATVNAYIDGIAASAASVIVMGCDKIYMPKNTMLMIHEASTVAWGKAAELRKEADTLEQLNVAVAASYANRFSGTTEELAKMLADDTYLTAEKAKECGLCDEVLDDIKIEDEPKQKENNANAAMQLLQEFAACLKIDKKEAAPKTKEPEKDQKTNDGSTKKENEIKEARGMMNSALAFFDALNNINNKKGEKNNDKS